MKVSWIRIPITALIVISAGLVFTAVPLTTELVIEPLDAQPLTQTPAPEELAKKSGCLECHSVDKNVVGPAYKDIAARYKGNADARAALIETVKKGGKGHWSEITKGVPMPPHQGRLSTADITRLVDWVLSLENR